MNLPDNIKIQAEEAVRKNWYLSTGQRSTGTPAWWRVLRTEGDTIVLLWGDCGVESNPFDLHTLTAEQWSEYVSPTGDGLYARVGFWSFTPAHNPASECIRLCHDYPESAGEELYELRQRLAALE